MRLLVGLTLTIIMIWGNSCTGMGPPVLEQQVLGYDEITSRLDQKLLMLNIARVDNNRPVHFTTTSSIAATFDWTTTIGIGGQVKEAPGTNVFNVNLGGSASENPTFQIIPLSGEKFTKQILRPLTETAFEFVAFEDRPFDAVIRLMAAGIEVQHPNGSFRTFLENDPRAPEEYTAFRQIALHLRWLKEHEHLFVRSLVFDEVLVDNFPAVSASDITEAIAQGLRWQRKPDGTYKLTRLSTGRVVVTNFDPFDLTDAERFSLNERIKKTPNSFVSVLIRPDRPGGDFPLQGAIKLRSLHQMLVFVANGIRVAQEFDVRPDPSTGAIAENPTATLHITVSESAPEAPFAAVPFAGKYYSIADTTWDHEVFAMLSDLFQTAVGDVESVGLPITISK